MAGRVPESEYFGRQKAERERIKRDVEDLQRLEPPVSMNGRTITGATIQATSEADRGVKMSTEGLMAFDTNGNRTFFLESDTGDISALGEFAAGDDENQVVLTRSSSPYFPNGYPGIIFPSSKYDALSYPIIQAETGVVDPSGFYSNPGGISIRSAMLGAGDGTNQAPGSGDARTVAGLSLNADGSWQLNGGRDRPGVYGRTDGYWEIGANVSAAPGERVRLFTVGKQIWVEESVTAADGLQSSNSFQITPSETAPTPTSFSTAASGKRTVLSGDYVTWYDSAGEPIRRVGPTGVEVRNGSAWVAESVKVPYATAAGTGPSPYMNPETFVEIGVTFPPGRFTQPPIVTATVNSSRINAGVIGSTVTTSGATLEFGNVSNGAAGAATFSWIAVQMTPTSATG